VVITENSCTIIDGAGASDDLSARIQQIRVALERAANDQDRDKLQERLARLSASVALIRVEAATGDELKERQHRAEDALSATRAAVEEGIIAGGGAALVHAERALDLMACEWDVGVGAVVVRTALAEPLYWIATNAGYDRAEGVEKVRRSLPGSGFNALTGEDVDMFAAGVMDPARVTHSALQSAGSIAALVLTTETLLVEEVIGYVGSVLAPGFGDLAEGLPRPSNPVQSR
jgi:chaperonin GroEL